MRIRELSQEEKKSVERVSYLVDTYCNGRQVVFSEMTGIHKSSVSQYMSMLHAPTMSNCIKIAKTFGVNLDWVRGLDAPMTSPGSKGGPTVSVPVYETIPSGTEITDLESTNAEILSVDSLKNAHGLFAFEIKDNAMSPRILKGDIVIVSPQKDAENDDLVVVSLCGKDAVCRRLMKYQGSVALFANNPNEPPVYIPEGDRNDMQILGKVIELRARF